MYSYTIDDEIDQPTICTVEVTIEFPTGKRWLLFITPGQLASNGGFVEGTQARMHFGERHMIVVSWIDEAIIDSVLKQMAATGELESRTVALT